MRHTKKYCLDKNSKVDVLVIRKPTPTAFQNTLTFNQYIFNYRSNMHVNLVHWNSLHTKRAIIPTFSGQTPYFLGENRKTRTNNLHHRKTGSVAIILSLRVGVQHTQKVAVECTLYLRLQGLVDSSNRSCSTTCIIISSQMLPFCISLFCHFQII